MRDIIKLAHNVIAGEHHLIIQLLRDIDIDIDSRRSAASGSSGRQHRLGHHRHHHCMSAPGRQNTSA